jgi:hypothetical protein
VSSDERDRRNYNLEPNIGWLIAIYQRTTVGQDPTVDACIAEWRREARY